MAIPYHCRELSSTLQKIGGLGGGKCKTPNIEPQISGFSLFCLLCQRKKENKFACGIAIKFNQNNYNHDNPQAHHVVCHSQRPKSFSGNYKQNTSGGTVGKLVGNVPS